MTDLPAVMKALRSWRSAIRWAEFEGRRKSKLVDNPRWFPGMMREESDTLTAWAIEERLPVDPARLFDLYNEIYDPHLALSPKKLLRLTRRAKSVCDVLDNALLQRFREEQTKRTEAKAATAGKKGKRPRKGRRKPDVRPLTDKQTDTVNKVGECKGDFAEAARRMGKDAKTVRQAYFAAMGKLGAEHQRTLEATWATKTHKGILRDKDGEIMADKDYRHGPGIRPNTRKPMHRSNDTAAGDRDDS